jgi:formylmethanofuran dehydrogenase subunit E
MNSTVLDLEYIEAILEKVKSSLKGISIVKQSIDRGMRCDNCKNDFPYAESNKSDGSFICYGCRSF